MEKVDARKLALEGRDTLGQMVLRLRTQSGIKARELAQITARAKTEGGILYWGDETAVKEDAHWVRGFTPAGRTPVLDTPARWSKLSMVSAITNRSEISFQIVEGSFKTSLCREPPSRNDDRLLRKAMRIMNRIAELPDRIRSYFQPPTPPTPPSG